MASSPHTPPKPGRPPSGTPPRVAFSIRTPPARHAEVCKAAAAERLTVSRYVDRVLAERLAKSK